jgi:ribosomal protein S6
VKKYEGLFILNMAGREEGIKDAIDKISADITNAGGKIENVQKMDKRPLARITNREISTGFYVNIIFESQPQVIAQLRTLFALREEIYRVLFTLAPEPKPVPTT